MTQHHFNNHYLDFNMTDNTHTDMQTHVDAAAYGLWGLVLKAMLREGKTSAIASMDAVANGRAFVSVEVVFTRRGVAMDATFNSHGEKGHLFSLTCMNPAQPTAPDSDAVH